LQDYNGDIVLPSPTIDKVWRIAVLSTEQYPSLCGKHFLHYKFSNPVKNDKCWQKYLQTVCKLQEIFNYEVDSDIWPTKRSQDSAKDCHIVLPSERKM
jgi:hypothetical protein